MTTFSFLVTTDNHMGFREWDHLRRKDSYMAFKEALGVAREKDTDFILLGGDLFHVNRPSSSVEHKCIKIIRQHMNAKASRGVSFKRVEGKFSHFRKLNHANFEDPNFTVPFPIMTIHGNHDDPTGPQAQSVCEKLATCGLLNYFGAATSTKGGINIEPIILQKGAIKIALYGLGFIPDFKLKIAFEKGEVNFVNPPKDTFNVLVVHQNRIAFEKQSSKYIADDLFPKYFHLIIRGHEHATESPTSLPESDVGGLVYQPGSTVATSISTMEAGAKKVGLITVRVNDPNGDQASRYKMNYELIDLKCCRRIICKDISQKEIFKYIKRTTGGNRVTSAEFKQLSKSCVTESIKEILKENSSQVDSQTFSESNQNKLSRFSLPLLRIRLEYTSKSERFDATEISSEFYPNLVANKNIVLYKKQKIVQAEGGAADNITFANDDDEEDEEEFDLIDLEEERRDTIDAMIESYFKDKPRSERLQALSLNEYTKAVQGSSEDGNVISKVLSNKKGQVFRKYRAAISDEAVARKNFHDIWEVEKWFKNVFADEVSSMGGDDYMDAIICD